MIIKKGLSLSMFLLAVVPVAILVLSFKQYAGDVPVKGLDFFSTDTLARQISIISSDEFEGRKPFTKAETKTINYLGNEFKRLGLQPGNGNSYFQDVPMVNITTKAADNMQVQSNGSSFELKGYDDYVIFTDKTDGKVSLNNTDVVFAGYGIVAPEYNWNDYKDLDVKNKVVMILVNDPGFATNDTSLFKGKTMTYYGRWTYKFEEAARQGAKGCLIVHETEAASYPFSVVQNNWNASRLHLDNRGKNVPYSDVIGWVTTDAAKKILAASGKDSSLLKGASNRDFKAVPLDVKLSTIMDVTATYNMSHNVIATITGKKNPAEYIIYSAHWDHLGYGKADETGDSIYNGALDNASGTAGLLELARVYKKLKVQPERTIVFLCVTAEEQGLWGSAYYAQNPIYPPAKTIANINMDGLSPFEQTNDIVVVGAGQSDLEDYLAKAAKQQGRYISFESHPEAGGYYRSDHFNFAKIGIPALYTSSGIDVPGKGKEYGLKQSNEYTREHYHRPSDEYNAATWTMKGGIANLKLLYNVGYQLAFSGNYPQWKNNSEFKAIRQQSLQHR